MNMDGFITKINRIRVNVILPLHSINIGKLVNSSYAFLYVCLRAEQFSSLAHLFKCIERVVISMLDYLTMC